MLHQSLIPIYGVAVVEKDFFLLIRCGVLVEVEYLLFLWLSMIIKM
jgi:hypothetical protein